MTQGYIHSLESFGSVDGPGVRYLIFTTGCAMRCQFCHNPDTWNMNSGTLYTADELIDKAWKYRTYWGSKGGITVSGGEPLLQIDFLLELFQKAKERGINTTLDTCGNPFTREEPFFSKFQELMKVTDLVMLDIKHIDDEQHKILTGQTNKNILDMAELFKIFRQLVPERSDKDEDLVMLHILLISTLPDRRIRIFLIWQGIFLIPENQSGSVTSWFRKEAIKTSICTDFMTL